MDDANGLPVSLCATPARWMSCFVKEEDIVDTATVLKLGKTQIFGSAECRSNSGKLLTYHTISYARFTNNK